MATEVQTVLFDKDRWTVTEAKKWLRDNDFISPKVDETDRYLRFRQVHPDDFKPKSFRTIPFGKNTGIKAVIGEPMKKNPRRKKIKTEADWEAMFGDTWFNENFRILSDSNNSSYGETVWISPKLGFKLVRHKRMGTPSPFRWQHSSGATGSAKSKSEAIEQMKKVKKNPFYGIDDKGNKIDPSGDGHRIGAYAMLFTKARNKYNALDEAGAGDSADAKLALAEAKEYWDQYQLARKQYETVEERRGGKPVLLHDFSSFKKAITGELPKRKNPMKTHKNPVIDGKTLVQNMKGLRKMVGKSIPATMKAVEGVQRKVLKTLGKLNEFGIDADYIAIFKGVYNDVSYQIDFIQSSMGDIALIFTQPKGSNKVKITIEYIDGIPYTRVVDELMEDNELFDAIYENSSAVLKGLVQGDDLAGILEYNVTTDDGSKYLLKHFQDYTIDDDQLKEAVYVPDPEAESLKQKLIDGFQIRKFEIRNNPKKSSVLYRYNPPQKVDDFEEFMDKMEDGNVFVGRYVIYIHEGVPMRLEFGTKTPKQVSPEVAFFADLAGDAVLVGRSDLDPFSDDYRSLIRQAGGVPPDKKPTKTTKTKKKDLTLEEALKRREAMVKEGKASEFLKSRMFKAPSDAAIRQFNRDKIERLRLSFLNNLGKFLTNLDKGEEEYGKFVSDATDDLAGILAMDKELLKEMLTDKNKDIRRKMKDEYFGLKGKLPTQSVKAISKYFDDGVQQMIKEQEGRKARVEDEEGKKTTIANVVENKVEEIKKDLTLEEALELREAMVKEGKASEFLKSRMIRPPTKAQIDEALKAFEEPESTPAVDPLMQMLQQMQAQSEAFKKQFKNNPRGGMHYAYPMSIHDHNHLYSYEPLNNVYIKKNPDHDFRFPQTEIKGVMIDADIYGWLKSGLADWDRIILMMEQDEKYAQYIPVVKNLQDSDYDFIIQMQTVIVPAVEEKVRKKLAKGESLEDIIKKANPRLRRNSKMSRRYN